MSASFIETYNENVLHKFSSFNLEVNVRSIRSGKDFHHNTREEEALSCPSQYSCCKTCVQETEHCRKCRCDSYCTFFNDCCSDHEHYHGNKEVKIPGQLEFRQLSCINEYLDAPIWIVNRCPDNKSNECENADKESWSGNDIRKLVPVHGRNSLVYRNEYCAECNGEYQIQHFGIKINCEILPPSSLTTINEKIMFALKYCGKDSISFQRRDDYKTRECFPNLVKHCSATNPYYERCARGPVGVVAVNGTNYRNKWCVSCMGKQYIHPKCGPRIQRGLYGPPKIASLSLVLDITNDGYSTHVQAKCGKKPYDSKLEICSRSSKSRSRVPKKRNIERYVVAVWFSSEKFTASRVSKKNIYSSLRKTFNINISQMDNLHFIKRWPNYFVITFRLWLTPEQTLGLAKQDNETMDNQEKTSFNNHRNGSRKTLPLKRLLFFTTEFNITMRKHMFTVFKTTYRQLTCINKQTYTFKQYRLLPNGSYYINSSGTTYEAKQVFFEDSAKQNISVCEQVVLSNCHGYQISLIESEYIKFKNLSIFYNGTNKIYHFGEYDIQNEKVIICLLPLVKIMTTPHQSITHVILTYLTLIGFALSLFCLFLIILTYFIFSELHHSIPGKNILNLSVSLFLAQLIWLTAVGKSNASVFCHVTAMVEHYLFLVSFVAMAMIAYQTYWRFSSKIVSRDVHQHDENINFLRYCSITWCTPAIFVGTCFVLDQQGIYTIYTDDQICWFENKDAQRYFFVLPVGVILFFNVICFILTVFHIHMGRSKYRDHLIASSHTRTTQTMFWIYLKIATLMGFSWLFGFLDLIVHFTFVFSYLFVIFTSLQGVYIAIAFIMNKRVFKMYKDLMRRKISKTNRLTEMGVVVSTNL